MDVLIISEDDPSEDKLTRLLEQFDHQVVARIGTQPGLRAFRDRLFDVLLVDHRAGAETDGDLVSKLRAIDESVPVVVFSSIASRSIDDSALEAGAVGFIALDSVSGDLLDRTLRYARRIQEVRTLESTRGRVGGKNLTLQVALARGMTIKDAAWAAGISERTAYRRIKNPEFRVQLAGLQHELRTRIVERTVNDLAE